MRIKVHYLSLALCLLLTISVSALFIYKPKNEVVIINNSGDPLRDIKLSVADYEFLSEQEIENHKSKLNLVAFSKRPEKILLHFFVEPNYTVNWEFVIEDPGDCFEISVNERLVPQLAVKDTCQSNSKINI